MKLPEVTFPNYVETLDLIMKSNAPGVKVASYFKKSKLQRLAEARELPLVFRTYNGEIYGIRTDLAQTI